MSTTYHPLVDADLVEQYIDEDLYPDGDDYYHTDHQDRVISPTRPQGSVPFTETLEDRLEIAVEYQMVEWKQQLAVYLDRIESLRGVGKSFDEEELRQRVHYANDAEFRLSNHITPQDEFDYVGRALYFEYWAPERKRRFAMECLRWLRDDPAFEGEDYEGGIHAVRTDGNTVSFEGTLPDLEPIERVFDVEITVTDHEDGDRRAIFEGDPETHGDRPRVPAIEQALGRLEGDLPTVRRDYVYDCSCRWSGTQDELELEGDISDWTVDRVCPVCGEPLLTIKT